MYEKQLAKTTGDDFGISLDSVEAIALIQKIFSIFSKYHTFIYRKNWSINDCRENLFLENRFLKKIDFEKEMKKVHTQNLKIQKHWM